VPARGVELVVAAAEADPCAGWKTTPRAARDAAARAAQDAGAFEALLALPGGAVVDAARANVWAVLDGRLVTPPLAHGALPGVVRALLLEGLAAAREAPLARADLARASEVFLTSSGLRVAPACAIRDLAPELPGADGPWARAARAALVQAEAAYARETR
jgi:branched-subunit amino acid aminotransferase/4-amino-4-deoxychorismate lyase